MKLESVEEEPSDKMLPCTQCPKTFKYNSERIRHEMSHSPGFECEVCSKKFSFISALRRHKKQHERTGSVKCDECNRTFRDEELLRRHVRYAHNGTFECSKCNGTFSSEQALRTHVKSHQPEAERRFKCSFDGCGKSFNFSHHLKHHELAHTNAKQHFCSVCGKGFIQSHHLKTHLKTHDPAEWLFCEFPGCKKKFATEYAKKRHMAIHKVKPDSGISSDSNSCDVSSVSSKDTEDFILCATCGENVDESNKHEHSAKCGDILNISVNLESCKIRPIKGEDISEQASVKIEVIDSLKDGNKQAEQGKATEKIDVDVGGCKSALGSCIMGANNCVCAQMSKPMEEVYDFTPIGNDNKTVGNYGIVSETNNNIDFNDRYSGVLFNFFDNKENEAVLNRADLVKEPVLNTKSTYNVSSMCEGCECVSSCTVKEPVNCSGNKNIIVKDTPNTYTLGGVVKIKDTFDIEIPIKVDSADKANSNDNKVPNDFVPFGTCRDVIGNCIVGGNEGCLCARMMIDEQQAMAQEIEDITPVPL